MPLTEDDDEIAIAVEVLSVAIGDIAERVASLAVCPPEPPATFESLAMDFETAGDDMAVLARAMAVLSRQIRSSSVDAQV